MTKRALTFSTLGTMGGLLLGAMALTSVACSGAGGANVDTPDGADESSVALTPIANVTFKTKLGGQFVGAASDAAGSVTATATTAKSTETFTVIDRNGGSLVSGDLVHVRSSTGKYLQAASGGGSTLNAASTSELDWETFRIVRQAGTGTVKDGDVVGLQTKTSGSWVSAQNGGGSAVFAYGGAFGPWEALIIGIGASTPTPAPTSTSDGGTTPPPPPPPSTGFVHPGVQVNKGQLDFVKAKIAAGEEPWTSAFNAAKRSSYGSLTYTPKPRADVGCGSKSIPDNGCSDEKGDVVAAYTQALLWYFTGNEAYAKKSIQIMNAWSAVLRTHSLSNAPLQSAWAASVFPRAAEIIRSTYTGWATADVNNFKIMLETAYLPFVENGSPSNGNWETSMIEASINIGVFLDSKPIFNKAVAMWKQRVPAYVYLSTDGATPVPPPRGNKTGAALTEFWYGQTKYVDGLAQETCRDLGHVQYGLASITNAAETATIQGQDLFALEKDRLRAGYEFHAQFINGAAVPSWLCGGKLVDATSDPMWEVGYNALVTRKGLAMPATKTLLPRIRPTGADHMMVWETLTHAGVGNAGL